MIKLEQSWCRNCSMPITRVPFQPDPTKQEWTWSWIHDETKRTFCAKTLYAEPRDVGVAR